jgi:hypothetical protein
LCWKEALDGCIERYIDDDASSLHGAALLNTLTGSFGDNGGTAMMAVQSLAECGYLKHVYSECEDDARAIEILNRPVSAVDREQAASTRVRPILTSIDPRGTDAAALVRSAIVAGHDVYADGPCNEEYCRRANAGETIDASCMTGPDGHAIRLIGFRDHAFYGYTSWKIPGAKLPYELYVVACRFWPGEFDSLPFQGLLEIDESALPAFWSTRPVIGVELGVRK